MGNTPAKVNTTGNQSSRQEMDETAVLEIPDIYTNYAKRSKDISKLERKYVQAMDELIQRAKTNGEKTTLQDKKEKVTKALSAVKETLEKVKSVKDTHDPTNNPLLLRQNLKGLQDKYEKDYRNVQQTFMELFIFDVARNPMYNTSRGRILHLGGNQPEECCVCQEEYELYERVEACPQCKNVFHRNCINRCLQTGRGCPLCRGTIHRRR